MALEAIKYKDGTLEILDQLLIPNESKYIPVRDTSDGWSVIKKMQVRGAPAIGVVGALSLAVEIHDREFSSTEELEDFVSQKLDFLVTARPTAVNMKEARDRFTNFVKQLSVSESDPDEVRDSLVKAIESFQHDDVRTNKTMGKHGADHILQHYNNQPVKILTHCNTGSLATAGYGTALGVVRALKERGRLLHCYCTETRPYNQGSRLTAYELVQDQIPGTLICDSAVSTLMKSRDISAVALGADRVVANGDTANKIGTYQLAIAAKYHNVPFYVVAPSTSIDLSMETGEEIVIEERPHVEMTSVKGVQLAPKEITCWNPAFDVTPADLITGGIVTEFGVFKPAELRQKITEALASQNSQS